MAVGVNPAAAGLLGGMAGGVVQAYATMGQSGQIGHLASFSAYTIFS
jgi:hypothetical protein